MHIETDEERTQRTLQLLALMKEFVLCRDLLRGVMNQVNKGAAMNHSEADPIFDAANMYLDPLVGEKEP